MVGGLVPKLQAFVLARYNWPPTIRKILQHPAGPFTIHFWCPWIKWGIVIANIADLKIPAENISANQQFVLILSGATWTRWCTQVTPFNANLMACSFFMACSAIYQMSRKLKANYAKSK